ncbi:MAG: methyltransferase domain-containing protein [Hyphomicrobium sp.]
MLFLGIHTITSPPQIFDRSLLKVRRARFLSSHDRPYYLLDAFKDTLKDRLSLMKHSFHNGLVLGAHHGVIGKELISDLHLDCLVEVETSHSILQKSNGFQVEADEEALPFADRSFDLIVSSLSLQFVNDLPGALLQIRRILKPDSLFIGGVLGSSTLNELRSVWLQSEMEIQNGTSPRVIPFSDVRDCGMLLQRAGFFLPVVDREILKVRYNSALELMLDLRGMGAGNILTDRSRSPITRRLLNRIIEIYGDQFADEDGRVIATFELIIMTGWSAKDNK